MAYLGQQLNTGRSEHFIYTASGSETTITTADDGRAIFYTPEFVDGYMHGVKLISGTDFTATSGSTIVLTSSLNASDVLEIVAINLIGISDTISISRNDTVTGVKTFSANTIFSGNTVTIHGDLNITGTTTTIDSASAQTVDLGDNDKIQLGDSNDLQIYHSGGDSLIRDEGSGNMIISTNGSAINIMGVSNNEYMGQFLQNDGVRLYYDNSQKFTTTSTGIDVTGDVGGDTLTISGDGSVGGQLSVTENAVITGNTSVGGTTTLADVYVTGQTYPRVTTLGSVLSSSISLNFANGNFFTATVANNVTMSNPSNMQPGQTGSIFLTQDSTGSRTVSFSSQWRFAGASHPTLTTTANATDRIDYVVYSSNAIHAVATLDLRNS